MAERFPVYGSHGFVDSVDVVTGRVSDRILILDQGMILAAIANALNGDVLVRAFSDGAVEAAVRPLIAPEQFEAGLAYETTPRVPKAKPVSAAEHKRPRDRRRVDGRPRLRPGDPGSPPGTEHESGKAPVPIGDSLQATIEEASPSQPKKRRGRNRRRKPESTKRRRRPSLCVRGFRPNDDPSCWQ